MCLGWTGLLVLAASEDAIYVSLNTHTHIYTDTFLQVTTSADASDVTSIRFSARKAKTAVARTKKKIKREDIQTIII